MSTQRLVTHLVSVVLLLLWGGVMLYFCLSGRIASYLPPDGIFRSMALVASVGLIALGVFNLATLGTAEGGEEESKSGSCCGCHDHGDDHDHASSETDHAHGVLEESSATGAGRGFAILILAVPLLVAATMSPDRFSTAAIINKGVYSASFASNNAAAPQTRLGSGKATLAKASSPTSTAPATPAVAEMPPAAPPSGTVAAVPSAGPRVPGSSAAATASVVVTTLPPAASASTPPAAAPTAAAGTAAATKSYGNFTLEDLKSQVPMSKEGNFILEVPELYYTAGDKEVQGVLAGQPVETTAQVLPEKVNNADGKRLRVFRLQIQCCAADARPYSVPVEFADKAPTIKDMTWVKVVGTMAYRQEGGQTVPVLEAKSIAETTAPDSSMLY